MKKKRSKPGAETGAAFTSSPGSAGSLRATAPWCSAVIASVQAVVWVGYFVASGAAVLDGGLGLPGFLYRYYCSQISAASFRNGYFPGDLDSQRTAAIAGRYFTEESGFPFPEDFTTSDVSGKQCSTDLLSFFRAVDP